MANKKHKLGCFGTIIIGLLVFTLSFIIAVGGRAAIDKSVERLVEYKDSAYSITARAFNLQRIENETKEGLTNLGVINDTLPKVKVSNEDDKNIVKVKLEIFENMMFIKPKINGIEMKCLLDTGCSEIHLGCAELVFMIHQGIIDKGEYVDTAICVYADGSEHECPVYILKNIELGGIKLDSVRCTAETNGDSMPLFGQAVLKRLGDVMINYSDSTLIIKKKNGK